MDASGWFLDSGSLKEIRKWKEVIGGITTNQIILFKKEKTYNLPLHISKIIKIVREGMPVFTQLPNSKASVKEMVDLAKAYHKMFPNNIVIKIPIIPDEVKGLKIISKLASQGIRTCGTVGINEAQLMLAAEAARRFTGEGSTYISLLWGRAIESKNRDESRGPEKVLEATINYLNNHNLHSKIIVGSIRGTSQVIKAFDLGADIVTVPPPILEKIMYTSRAKETMEEFDSAYEKVKRNKKLKII